MNKLTLICFSVLASFASFAQTVIWTETFSNGCTAACSANGYTGPNGAWTQTITGTEGTEPNAWYVSCAENNMGAGNCGAACQTTPNPTLHISSDLANPFCANDCGAAYDAGGFCGTFTCPQTDRRIESPVIDLTGQTNITLNFVYIEGGSGTTDNATVWYFNGSTWSQLVDEPATNNASCGGQGLWTTYSVALPASADNNPNVKIGFRWVNNDDGVGTDPSFAVDDITLTVPSSLPPTAAFNTTNTNLCAGDCISFTNTSVTTGATTWNWDFGGGATNSTAQNPTGVCFNTPGTYTITLTVTDANGTDTEVKNSYILVTAAPVAGADGSLNVCDNTSTFLNTLLSGAQSGGTWAETTAVPSGQFNTVTTEFNSSALAAGVYTFTYTKAGTGPCPDDVATFTITVTDCAGPAANISASSVSICAGQSIIFNDASSGTNVDTWSWSFGGGTPGTANTAGPHNITFNTPGTFDVLLVVTDDTGTDDQTIQITVAACSTPTAAFGIDNNPGVDATICPGDCITFDNNSSTVGPTTYEWTFTGGTPASSVSANPGAVCYNTPGTYPVSLLVTNSFGSSTYTQNITVVSNPTFSIDSIVGVYSVIIGPNEYHEVTIDAGETVSLIAFPFDGQMSWTSSPSTMMGALDCTSSDCSEVDVSPVVNTTYTAITTTTEGCQATVEFTIYVNGPEGGYTVGVPNSFSPNNDGINDILRVRSFEDKLIAEMNFKVFNRYGELVFQSIDADEGWDGTFRDQPEAPGTFAFTLDYTLFDGTTGKLNGNVTLVR